MRPVGAPPDGSSAVRLLDGERVLFDWAQNRMPQLKGTTEFEPGLARTDLRVAYELIAPVDGEYEHEKTWNDDNGHAHVRASITGPSITVPLVDGALTLGTWQQVVLIDFDTRARRRQIVVQVIGE